MPKCTSVCNCIMGCSLLKANAPCPLLLMWSRPHLEIIKETPRLQTGVGNITVPASVCFIFVAVVFDYKIVCISQFFFVPLLEFGYYKGRVLRFEMREEALDGGVVYAIAPTRHADSGTNLRQHVVVCMGRVLESLVAVVRPVQSCPFISQMLWRTLGEPARCHTFAESVGHNLIIE